MAQATSIEWTDVSWNPVHGCSRVSTGCKNCYAETLSLRYGQTAAPWTERNAAQNVTLKPHKLREPLSKAGPWKNPCRVFVNSMSDLFHGQIPFKYIAEVFAVMAEAQQHTFQILTKRPERMLAYFEYAADYMGLVLEDLQPWPNVWLGVSIENRKWVSRADVLRQTPAAVRFISAEPLLGPLVKETATTPDTPRVERRTRGGVTCRDCGRHMDTWQWQCAYADCDRTRWPDGHHGPELSVVGIDWLIIGGESGPGHRPMRVEWATDLVAAAREVGCAPFVKQLGGARPGTKLEDLPEGLRVREFPERVA